MVPDIVLPTTRNEAEERIDRLKIDITSIQQQLHKRKKPRKGSSKADERDFYVWRHKAVDALQWKQRELATLKSWRRQHLNELSRKMVEGESTVSLLYRVHRVCKHLLSQDVVIDQAEQETMDTVQTYLRSIEL